MQSAAKAERPLAFTTAHRVSIIGRNDPDAELMASHLDNLNYCPVVLDTPEDYDDFHEHSTEPYTQICLLDLDAVPSLEMARGISDRIRTHHPAIAVLATSREQVASGDADGHNAFADHFITKGFDRASLQEAISAAISFNLARRLRDDLSE